MDDMSNLILIQISDKAQTEAFDNLTEKVQDVLVENENILVYSVLLYLMFITIDRAGPIKESLLQTTIKALEGVMEC